MLSTRRAGFAILALFLLLVLYNARSFRTDGALLPPNTHQSVTIPEEDLSKVIIIASMKDDDMSWLKNEVPDVDAKVYVVDDPTAELKVPTNKGHEGMVYLTYLIDHYETLPDIMVFLHAHKVAWHNNDLLGSDAAQMIRALSAAHVKRQGYFNLRCHWDPGCPEWMHPFDPSNRTDISKPEERELAEAFKQIFPGREVPETIATPCCAQFALSREAVLRVSKNQLEVYRNWLLNTPLHDIVSGRVWEYLWHYVFTDFTPVVCQAMDVCYCDGFGLCFGGEEYYKNFSSIRNDMRLMQIALNKWTKEYKDSAQEMSEAAEGVKTQLERKIAEVSKVTSKYIEEAKIRGADPQLRAQDSGRRWKHGDGY